MRTIRASEISAFIFCQRAWWYRRQGIEPINRAEMSAGSQYHEEQGKIARSAIVLQAAAWVLLFAVVVLISLYLASQAFR
jgi:hypothetical protein